MASPFDARRFLLGMSAMASGALALERRPELEGEPPCPELPRGISGRTEGEYICELEPAPAAREFEPTEEQQARAVRLAAEKRARKAAKRSRGA